MKKLAVYDPAMCCPSGVCGPSVDPVLPRFAADVEWLKQHGVRVERYNLAQQIRMFVQNETVKHAMEKHGPGCLPLLLVDGQIVSMAKYPTREELAAWTGLDQTSEPVAAGQSDRGGVR